MIRQTEAAVFLGFLALSLALIWIFPQPLLADQSFIAQALDPYGPFPKFESGLASILIVRALGIVLPLGREHLNEVIRSLAALFYSVATFLLLARFLQRRACLLVCLMVLFTSRLPVLWLSSELLAGGFLALAVWFHDRQDYRRAGVALAVFALCKPELVLPGAAVLATWTWIAREHRGWVSLLWPFAFVIAIANAPGLVTHGMAHFQGNRSWMAFSQHYSALFGPHQFDPAFSAEPFGNWERNVGAVFPGVQTLGGVLLHYPSRYLDFFALAQMHLLKRLLLLANFFLVPAGLLLAKARYRGALTSSSRISHVTATMLAAGTGLLPITLISFVHVRYLAKYYPLALTVMAVGLERAAFSPRDRKIVLACVTLGLLLQTALFALTIRDAAHGGQVWMPD